MAYGDLAINYNHDDPALIIKGDNNALIEFKPGSGISVGVAPPTAAKDGDLWWDSTAARLFLRYTSGTPAVTAWVDASPAAVPPALANALTYKGTIDPTVAGTAPAKPSIGDTYVASKAGTVAAGWAGLTGSSVSLHELLVWDGSEWDGAGTAASARTSWQGSIDPTAAKPAGYNAVAGDLIKLSKIGAVHADWAGVSASASIGDVYLFDGASWRDVTTAPWTRNGTTLTPAASGDLVDPAALPAATATARGTVQVADAAAITAGTAGRVVDAAQLKAAGSKWSRTGTTLSPATAGDLVATAALPSASESAKGAIELATTAETELGSDDLRAITPLKLSGVVSRRASAPVAPARGQIWLDTSSDPPALRVWDDTPPPGLWKTTGAGVVSGPTAPAGPVRGDSWVNTSGTGTPVLSIWDGSKWATAAASVWSRTGTTLSPATAGDLIAPAALPVATATAAGAVQVADAAAITAGTAGRVVDAAQLKAASSWKRTGTTLSPVTAGDLIAPAALPVASATALGGVKVGTNLEIDADGVLKAKVTSTLIFRGTKDPATAAPTNPATGDVYVMSKAGTLSVSWTGLAGTAVEIHDLAVWDGSEWDMMGPAIGTTVHSVTATTPLKATGTTTVALTVDDATVATKGVVQLADAAAITAGTASRVVDAAQLKTASVWTKTGTTLGVSTAGDLVAPAALPVATVAAKGAVQLADAAAITAGTAGRVVDAAQLKAISDADDWTRTGTTIAPRVAGDVVSMSAGTAALPGLTPVGDSNTGLWSPATDTVAVSTGGTERIRIRSDGNIGIGGAGGAIVTLYDQAPITGGTTAYGSFTQSAIQSDVTTTALGYATGLTTAAAAFTLAALHHFSAQQSTFGAGSTVTNQFGFSATNTLIGATNNFGFYGHIPSGTGRWNFYAAGTAPNYFAGDVRTNTVVTKRQVPAASNTTGTVATATSLLEGLRISTPTADITLLVPTGTSMDAQFQELQLQQSFEWSLINLATAASGFDVTVTANTAHTVAGRMVVTGETSGRFLTRKTAANTFITYRIA
jgi:hypothetical protein